MPHRTQRLSHIGDTTAAGSWTRPRDAVDRKPHLVSQPEASRGYGQALQGHEHCKSPVHEVDTANSPVRELRTTKGVNPRNRDGYRCALRRVQLRGVADETSDAPCCEYAAL